MAKNNTVLSKINKTIYKKTKFIIFMDIIFMDELNLKGKPHTSQCLSKIQYRNFIVNSWLTNKILYSNEDSMKDLKGLAQSQICF